MIDEDGYRINVGIVICNRHAQVLWARRVRQNSWQFPQGGVDEGETPETAMYRELYEELGLERRAVSLLGVSRRWLRYRIPKRLVRDGARARCIGQIQKWFLLSWADTVPGEIRFDRHGDPEFDQWRWVSYWYPVRQVIAFKQDVYRQVLVEFAGLVQQAGAADD